MLTPAFPPSLRKLLYLVWFLKQSTRLKKNECLEQSLPCLSHILCSYIYFITSLVKKHFPLNSQERRENRTDIHVSGKLISHQVSEVSCLCLNLSCLKWTHTPFGNGYYYCLLPQTHQLVSIPLFPMEVAFLATSYAVEADKCRCFICFSVKSVISA